VDSAPPPDPAPAPAPAPAGAKSAAGFFGILIVLGFLGALAQAASPVIGLAWSEIFAFLVPAALAAVGSNLRPSAYLRLGRARPAALAVGLVAGGAGYLVASAIMAAAAMLLPAPWVEGFDLSHLLEGDGGRKYAFAAVAALLAPVCEEAAFRGYLQTTFGLRRGPVPAIAASAVLFAVIHVDPVRLPALLALGALFGWLAWRAGSIWPAVAAHAANNATASFLFLARGNEVPDPAPTAAAIGVVFAVGLAALVPLLAAYRALTPAPPPFEDALVLRDPARPSIAFSPGQVPPGWAVLWVAGSASLAALLLVALLRAGG
jgi:membrane protease YdiL (CAAX protease family)